MEVRVILDSGSQRSYVSHRVTNALCLAAEGEQRMSITTFGSDQGDPQVCQAVRIGMRVKEGRDKQLVLFTVPRICEPLVSQPITLCTEQYDHLSQLELADSSESNGDRPIDRVGLLLGVRDWWDTTWKQWSLPSLSIPG